MKESTKCIMPEMPYCPCCEYGYTYREPWWEDEDEEWICGLKGLTKKQKKIIEERNRYY